MKTSVYVIAAIIVVVVAAVALISAGARSVPILLTDPPNVPTGTSQLLVTYSSVAVHTSSGAYNQSGWVTASGSGTVNLMALVNVSKTIATASITANSTINLVRLNITSIKIVINNATYNVSTPNNQITVAVVGQQKLNATSGILIDIFPTVNVAANGTYLLVPAARAIVIGINSTASASASVGGISHISSNARAGLGLNITH